ncbi:uncharacterized protein LOC142338499 [Convolutriloba macropyga]|uniref:uncharacterized protein LOC142338499 n=1 Tax=Convolutriloba macropyga TaxID=536237 RepID=UPI003F527C77
MKSDIEFQHNYGETISSSMEMLSSGFAGDTIPISEVKGRLDAEVILTFLSYQRETYGPMNNVEKGVYAHAMRQLAELRDKPNILSNCLLNVIIPGDRTVYTHSFQTGNGENQFTISANQKGEPTDMSQTHKSPSEQRALGKRLFPALIIFIIATMASLVITGITFHLKSSPVTARLDGVLHARMALASPAHDPYADPQCDYFPKGKLY